MLPLKDENPTRTFPLLTIGLIAANCLVFIRALSGGFAHDINAYGLIPAQFMQTPALHMPNFFTAMFMHAGWGHLAGNMLYLWIFGNNIEDALGRTRFILFYGLCGVMASALHIIGEPQSTVPLVGASGAISGVLGAYLILYPRARIVTLIFLGFYMNLVRVPALVVLGFWFIVQIVNSAGSAGGNVAWMAHTGGFAAGMLLIKPFQRVAAKRRALNAPYWE